MPLRSRLASPPIRWLLVLTAGAVGYAVNGYPVMLVGGLLVFFGQIPALACAIALGPLAGGAAAAVSAARFVLWGQPLTFALHAAGGIAIGILSRRWRPLKAGMVFWVAMATPALIISLVGVRHMAFGSATLAISKNLIAGMLDVVVAAIIVGQPLGWRDDDGATRASLVTTLNRRIAAVLTVPALGIVVLLSTQAQRNAEALAYRQLDLEAARYAASVNEYVRSHVRTVATVAAAVSSGALSSEASRTRFLAATHAENPGFLTMLLADSTGVVRHAISGGPRGTPPVAQLPTVSDRAYFRAPMTTGRPFVSSAFMGRGFGRDVIYAVSAPIRNRQGAPAGIVEGSLSVGDLASVIAAAADVDVTLADEEGQVIFSTVAARWPPLSMLPASVRRHGGPHGRFWLDDVSKLTVMRERLYATTATERGWTILAERPRYAALQQAAVFGTTLFLASLTLLAVLLAAVRMLNAVVARPLADLAQRTAALDWSAPAPRLDAHEGESGPREVAVVSEALTRAAGRIAESYRETQLAMAARDVALTEREATLRSLDLLVQERTQQLELERDRAQAASRAKSAFLANMSHELRTPLNVILGMGESLTDGVYGRIDGAQQQALGEIEQQGNHLLMLINEVLDFARIESGRVSVQLADVDISMLVAEVCASFQESARQQSVTLDAERPPACGPVRADAFRLRQVLINLVGNALKFTPRGGRITVTLEAAADNRTPVAVHVSDTGMGIPPDRLPHIFDAFEQAADHETRAHGGTGLGLTISRSLAEAMGMQLTATSELGAGSSFTLRFAAAS